MVGVTTVEKILEGYQNILSESKDSDPFVSAAADNLLKWIDTISLEGTDYLKFLSLIFGTTRDRQLWDVLGDWWYYKDILRFMYTNKEVAYDLLLKHPHIVNFYMDGRTFLSRTIVFGYHDEIEKLLEVGADPYIKSLTDVPRDSFEYWIQYRNDVKMKDPVAYEKIRKMLIGADNKMLYQDRL
jgi:hypothetical protein